jgi:hypothetical protein
VWKLPIAYLSKSIILLTVHTIPAVFIAIGYNRVFVTEPTIHLDAKLWPEIKKIKINSYCICRVLPSAGLMLFSTKFEQMRPIFHNFMVKINTFFYAGWWIF